MAHAFDVLLFEASPVAAFAIDLQHRVTHFNAACGYLLGVSAQEVIGKVGLGPLFYGRERAVMADLIVDGAMESILDDLCQNRYRRSLTVPDAYEAEGHFPNLGKSGMWLFFTAAPLRNAAGEIVGAMETLQDITQRKVAEEALMIAQLEVEKQVEERTLELASAQEHLVQSEKLASIGQLAAGVAHEINNPVGYVNSNMHSLQTYVDALLALADALQHWAPALPDPQQAQVQALLQTHEDRKSVV